jgi:hypothetical protein
MEQEILKSLVAKGLTTREISEHQKCSQTTVRYWLKKFGLRVRRGPKGKIPKDLILPRKCACGETDPTKFYGHKKSICGKCQNQYNIEQRKKVRDKALEYYGGKCKRCGFNKYSCALDFHHIDPESKDINFNSAWSWSWPRLRKELDKCILLCKNCHAAVHTGELKL